MMKFEISNIDSEDIDDLLVKVEKSFGIGFSRTELIQVDTFGKLCDLVLSKIQLTNSDDCTSQQAFYKLRNAITKILDIDSKTITPNSPLSEILPRQNRRENVAKLENYLGIQFNILRLPIWIINSLSVLSVISIVVIFFDWKYGLAGFLISLGGLYLSDKVGKELNLQTVKQLAEKITRENYLKSRRNPNTFNKNEIEKILTDWFCNDLDLNKNKLTRETKLV